MNEFQNVFRRFEKKYVINSLQYEQLISKIGDYLVPDEYGESLICSIYFDTSDYRLIRSSIEKPIYKEKLRMRCYGVPNDESIAFVELKKKYKGIVYKRRVSMKYADAYEYLFNDKPLPEKTQITNEIDYFKSVYKNVIPAMFISYSRVAMFHKDNPNLRITFDRDITWRTDRLDLRLGSFGSKLLDDDSIVMEIKIPQSFPLWLANVLDELRIFPNSYSKYGNAYKHVLESSRILHNDYDDNEEKTGAVK